VKMEDTAHGLKITVHDLTTGESGFMVSSAANGFASIRFDPNGTTCDFATHNIPYDFHPMYATASEHTRVPWAAHGFSVGFSDEIGHFEYCSAVDAQGGHCTQPSINDPAGPDVDDRGCFTADFASSFGLVPVGGCLGEDDDYDGLDYGLVWPGTIRNARQDRSVHSQPVQFTSPVFKDREGESRNYSRVAFETDLPRTEFATNPPCQRHISNPADPNPGSGCVNHRPARPSTRSTQPPTETRKAAFGILAVHSCRKPRITLGHIDSWVWTPVAAGVSSGRRSSNFPIQQFP